MFAFPVKRMLSQASSLPANMSTCGPISEQIKLKVRERFPDLRHFAIYNDSYKHAGHAGMEHAANRTESHLRLEVVSEQFSGMALPKRHRLLYTLLDDEIKHHGVHALQLTTRTPEEHDRKTEAQLG
ncbi:ADR397Cp [Eremothecium gossypii ATCC 10895]|uniref:ADR397Cp n=1 Tax=Eremothecium gossypii (strain ATCC 10895 / CBS 109.51 / FGSC 9923 / NRRL Y-1056) TaxID=284811 RepID=Q758Y1_EREGS|nr:ADR397Cp [Eremothecium gossypii ATCC 10895]AAS52316.1 ADR397Cp [Eremothecium gossypii ATCC 10895]AEY96613.1 FADR397Cp [Eremothecium gossypii FDAG1]